MSTLDWFTSYPLLKGDPRFFRNLKILFANTETKLTHQPPSVLEHITILF